MSANEPECPDYMGEQESHIADQCFVLIVFLNADEVDKLQRLLHSV